ncbi:MAG: PadR family transcriptional regulator, partial [Acidimicrobiia bacterium]|nr:PadR family transcriptional regulator [Acidimicrobiia bacterium]
VGQVYTTLQRLQRAGLVESDGTEGGNVQNLFRLTDSGTTELTSWLRTPPDDAPPPRNELVIKVMVATHMPGVDVHDLLQVHRRQLVERMQEFTHVKAQAHADDVALALVVDAELFRLEGMVRWLDDADARLAGRPSPAGDRTAPADTGGVAASASPTHEVEARR